MTLAVATGTTPVQALDELAGRIPGCSLVFPGQRSSRSAADLVTGSQRAAGGLLRAGVEPGDRIGLLMSTTPALPTVLFAALRTGSAASLLPLGTGLGSERGTAARLAPLLRAGDIQHVVFDSQHATLAGELAAEHGGLALHEADRLMGTDRYRGSLATEDGLAVIQFTSGSTARPRGVALTNANVMAGLRAISVSAEHTMDDVLVQWVPLFHDMGLFGALGTYLGGCPVHLFPPSSFIRRPVELLAHMADVGATLFTAPNFAYELMLDALARSGPRGLDLSRWRLAYNGAEAVRSSTVSRFADALAPYGVGGQVMYPVYGLAEAVLAAAFPRPGSLPTVLSVDRDDLAVRGRVRVVPAEDPRAKHVVSVGRPVHGMQLRLVDSTGRACPDGTVGEILLRGPAVTRGYVGAQPPPEVFSDGWFHTGDLGFRCAGELFVTGRAKEMVVVHGRNFYAEDVESVARAVPGVYRRRCVAFADGDEVVTVAVEPERGTAPEELVERIRRELADRLDLSTARVRVVPQRWLPQTTSGKWQRQLARDLLAANAHSPS